MQADIIAQDYAVGSPRSTLRPWLDQYQGFYEALAHPRHRLQVPRARVFLILGFGNELRVRPVGSQGRSQGFQSFVVGIAANPLLSEHRGARHCIEIPIAPWMAHRLFQGAAAEFAGDAIALEDLWGQDAQRLTAQVSELPFWSERFAFIDQVLAAKIAQSQWQVRPEICWAWNQLESHGGCLSIRQLARSIGWSDRYFASCFREHIGITPKAAARQIRFTQAHQRVLTGADQSLSETAATCGYSDQSHLTREFQAFSGCSPQAWQQGVLPS